MFSFQRFEFNPFQENTYVLFDDSREAVVIDPGCYERDEQIQLDHFIENHRLQIKFLLNTHCHIDHVLGNSYIKQKYDVPFLIPEKELPVLKAVKVYAPNYGFNQYHEVLPDGFLGDTTINFGKNKLTVISLPGHSPGHVGFYLPGEKKIFSGDVLFKGSIGRTDLPGGDYKTLIQSIHSKLFSLPDDVEVYPGHGDSTSLAQEKETNPFCALSLR
jgi:glyoxylase-like metal-dependent hydrolase (beta-lactamase superfamily II)